MKSKVMICSVLGVLSLTGCAANHALLHRGWVGGEYRTAEQSWFRPQPKPNDERLTVLPAEVKSRQTGAVLVTRVYPGTPLAAAGVQEGDLILSVRNQTVNSPAGFRRLVDGLKPGETAELEIFRLGQVAKVAVTVGKETYQRRGSLSIGLGLGGQIDLIPDPEFNILSLVRYRQPQERWSLQSPEHQYLAATAPGNPVNELWNLWLVIFGVSQHDEIIRQECQQETNHEI